MERLTERNEYGGAYYKRCYASPCDGTGESCDNCDLIVIEVCEALAAYEDTGLSPEQIIEMGNLYAEKCKELAEVKKLIPPCKAGDTLYQPAYSSITKVGGIEEMKVLEASNSRIWAEWDCFDRGDLGKTVFLTQAEAEEALKKMKEMEEQ